MWCSERSTGNGAKPLPGAGLVPASGPRAAYGASAAPGGGRKRRSPRPRAGWGAPAGDAAELTQWEELLPHLPEGARLLWRALGDMRLLRRVLAEYGGRTLRIPVAVPPEGHALRRRLGPRALTRLCAALGGTEVYVPTCGGLLSRLRQQEIIRAFSRATAAGMSSVSAVAALAGRYSLSDRRIWQILKTTAEAPRAAQVLRALPREAGGRARRGEKDAAPARKQP
ncbi:Mor transcription activator family protein [Desulfovibrio sp.]|uniref:Mor transcription activator family protein n=1 Tax=Desulfovibrio sp. TaxID=885 RepID=UPI0023D6C368|nr:Mor transcription activator family protein [Desulfovibrio sp.]MDE7240775.1 hypothetical protein [Desulfovibrio sp.]